MTQRDLIRRFGTTPKTVTEDAAIEKVRQGEAEIVGTPPSSETIAVEAKKKPKHKPRDYGGRRIKGHPYVAWVHDTERYGGAELSNQTVIEVGRRLGFEIYECFPATFDKQKLVEADLLIINNFFFFEAEQYHFILDLLFEYKRPYVKYEHDHREVYGDRARPKLARLLFGRSFLNIFISPFQAENHRKKIGDLIDPYYLLPPAIDTEKFELMPEIERIPRKVINMTGRLYHSKGLQHIAAFAKTKSHWWKFEVYTKNVDEVREYFGGAKVNNVKVFPPVEHDKLPEIYNSAEFTIHLPQAFEACGRTIAEGVLCGCSPIYNENVGIKSFKYFHLGDKKEFKYDKFKEIVRIGPYMFWKAVDIAFNGYIPRKRIWERSDKRLRRKKRDGNHV